jgi:putative hydrolase of the HAD superfamily
MSPTGVIFDFGGVLTSDVWEALRACARSDGLAPEALVDYLTREPDGVSLMHGLEDGSIDQATFERTVARQLGVAAEGLLSRMAADLRPNDEMLDLVAALRDGGVRVAVLSNSWGSDYFDPYAPWQLGKHFDVVVLSDRVRLRKPDPTIYMLTAERLAVPVSGCVFVDDIAAYAQAATRCGMTGLHHRNNDQTMTELRERIEVLLQVEIGGCHEPVHSPTDTR